MAHTKSPDLLPFRALRSAKQWNVGRQIVPYHFKELQHWRMLLWVIFASIELPDRFLYENCYREKFSHLSYRYSVDYQMLFLFYDFPSLRSFSLYIASFKLENCQTDSHLSFDITNESFSKYHKSSCEYINASKSWTETIASPKNHYAISNKNFNQSVDQSKLQLSSDRLYAF